MADDAERIYNELRKQNLALGKISGHMERIADNLEKLVEGMKQAANAHRDADDKDPDV